MLHRIHNRQLLTGIMAEIDILVGKRLEADFYFVSLLSQTGKGEEEGEKTYVDSLQH